MSSSTCVRRHVLGDHRARRAAVVAGLDRRAVEPVALAPRAPAADRRREGVDEHAVHVGDDRGEGHPARLCRRRGAGAGSVRPTARRASANTTTAPRIIVASAHGSDTASASTPMNGGPARKPSEPSEETAAMAGPGRRVGLAPGGAEHQRHAVGDAEADREQAGERGGLRADQEHRRERDPHQQRAPAQQGDRAHAAVEPIAEDAPDRHAAGEEGERERGHRGAGAEVLAQVEPAPVGHRALGEHQQQAQDREQQDAARGQREARGAFALGGRAVPDPARARDDDRQHQRGRERDRDARVDAGRGEPRREAGARSCRRTTSPRAATT